MANETVLFKRGDSATITSTPVTDGQILFDTSGNGKMYLDNGTDRLEMGGAITVDASLSNTSTNAIQNKAVTGNILNSLAEVSAATQQNTIAGALALKEVNSSLSDVSGSLTGLIGFPQYKSLQTIAEESAINFTPQCNGFVSLITDSGIVKNVDIHINGKFAMNVTNSIMFPIRRGDVITSTSTVRLAYFYPSE